MRWWKRRGTRVLDPQLIEEQVNRAAFEADLELIAVLPAGSQEGRGA